MALLKKQAAEGRVHSDTTRKWSKRKDNRGRSEAGAGGEAKEASQSTQTSNKSD